MLAFTVYDHFRDIAYDCKHKNMKTMVIKSVLTPITLPLKLIGATIVSVGFLLSGLSQLVIPHQTCYSVWRGKRAAHFYFYVQEAFRNACPPHLKLIVPLKSSFDCNENNPFWKTRSDLVNKIDKSIGGGVENVFDIAKSVDDNFASDKFREIRKRASKKHFESEKRILKGENVSFTEEEVADRDIQNKFEEARKIMWKINSICSGRDAVINDWVPIWLKV